MRLAKPRKVILKSNEGFQHREDLKIMRKVCCVSSHCRVFGRFSRAPGWVSAMAVATALAFVSPSKGEVCVVADAGGTAIMPPNCFSGQGYLSPADVHAIIDGLPPGTTIELDASHSDFFGITPIQGGERFNSSLCFDMQGTGDLGTFQVTKCIPNVLCETQTGQPPPPAPGFQSFPTEMMQLQGDLPPGDPDFDLLAIRAGVVHGLPSPGHTTLRQVGGPGSDWVVDSFFDIAYRIDFVGSPGGPLSGMSGSTTGTIRMQAGEPGSTVQPGPDPWHTVPLTEIKIGSTGDIPPIPADFFYPGSLPFEGQIQLTGDPINPGDTNTDTIVERLEVAVLPNPGASDTVQIELKELSLTSVAPIDVGGIQFVVYVDLDPTGPSSLGSMTIVRNNNEGGTFTSQLNVHPRVHFRQVGGGPLLGPIVGGPIPLENINPHPWCYQAVDGSVPAAGPNFFPKLPPLIELKPAGSIHTVTPPDKCYQIEFSVDIGGDTELSDPNADGDEGFDPGDVYLWKGPSVSPPVWPCGRQGFKDDRLWSPSFSFDPLPDPAVCGSGAPSGVCPVPCDPAVCTSTFHFGSWFDLDGHDQLDVSLFSIVPPALSVPIPRTGVPSSCIYDPRFMMISFDDDTAPAWTATDVPVTASSPVGAIYGQTANQDEVVTYTLGAGPPYPAIGPTPFSDEVGMHISLGPNPAAPPLTQDEDDDIDSLDIVPNIGACPVWYFSPDHEGHVGLDPGSIYQVMPGGGFALVIDDVAHLGIGEDTDLDAFEFTWLPDAAGISRLAVLFSVDDDDPCTTADESGAAFGLGDPTMIYGSFLTGSSFPVLTAGLGDDIDAITLWCQNIKRLPEGACCIDVAGAPLECVVTSQCDCSIRGGVYKGDGTTCDDLDGDNIADICQDCRPLTPAQGYGCTQNCPGGQQCVPTLIEWLPGVIPVVLRCECTDLCHVDFDFNTQQPFCVKPCPTPGETCDLVTEDLNMDGVLEYRCECNSTADCEPLPPALGFGCTQNCPPGQQCVPTLIEWVPGAIPIVLDCDCTDFCHVDFDFAADQPFCFKPCPNPADDCVLVAGDVDMNGVTDYHCECQPVQQDCDPDPASPTGCSTTVCPIAGETCLPRCITVDAFGVQTVSDCECRSTNECTAEFGPAFPLCSAVGCPAPLVCKQTVTPVPGGGDQFCCDCVLGCCLPNGTCEDMDPIDCAAQNGIVLPGLCSGNTVACCFQDGHCEQIDESCCVAGGGTVHPPGASCTASLKCCLPDGTCDFMDPLCCQEQGGVVSSDPNCNPALNQGCCLPDGSCIVTDPNCCQLLGGQVSPALCLADQACCIDPALAPLGCLDTDPVCCQQIGGSPLGPAFLCSGVDLNGTGVDDVCEACVDKSECYDGSACTCNLCVQGLCENPPRTYGDVDCNGTVSLFDLFCVLDGFSNNFTNCNEVDVDLDPCPTGNGTINLGDLFAVLNAFSDIDPCCGGGPAPQRALGLERGLGRTDDLGASIIRLVPTETEIRPGGLVTVNVFAERFVDLRGFEIKVIAAGHRGSLDLVNVDVELDRKDFAFRGQTAFTVVDESGGRFAGIILEDGVASTKPRYLGSFTYKASRDARGSFEFSAIGGAEAVLANTLGEHLTIETVVGASINVR